MAAIRRASRRYGALIACAATTGALQAAGVPGELEEVQVTARRLTGLAGQVTSASEGTVLGEQLHARPIQRTGEILEVVPGLIVTQHSGGGKANQFFLRGFNLDHGTDFASSVEGIPVNMPTHAHGQGYSDVNFMIPELIDRVIYRKGTYYAEEGNFSAAGAVDLNYARRLDRTLLSLTGGEFGYGRGLIASSPRVAGGDLLLAADSTYSDGPWELAEHLRKFNGVIKYTRGDSDSGVQLLGMGYRGEWRSTDQIPLRAVSDGRLDRFGHVDPTDGGNSHRYSVSAAAWRPAGPGSVRASGYAVDYGLDLFSNFTYFTDAGNGDQFEQFDDRKVYGAALQYRLPFTIDGRAAAFRSGADWRRDDIATVGLYRTRDRARLSTMREDAVIQDSHAVWVSQEFAPASWLRAEAGLRFDAFRFAVDSNIAVNSGTADDDIISPKLALVLGPWRQTELFLNWGRGFHSNDARGTTITVDPLDGTTPVDAVTPLVRATGEEIGIRTAIVPRLQVAASLWSLDVDSELLFIGDGGITEATRASRRHGAELSLYFTPTDSVIVDADVAWTRPRFTDDDPAGRRVPNAVERVASLGVSYQRGAGWFGGARFRYLGPAALLEDNSVRSRSTLLVNLNAGYRFSSRYTATVTLLNAMDKQANDITYFYESQLAGEAAPVEDVHFHPVEPRQVRLGITAQF